VNLGETDLNNQFRTKDAPPCIVLIGSMKVGKSALFSRICDRETANLNTEKSLIAVHSAQIRGTDKIAYDTPGIYSIFSGSDDERACRDILLPGYSENRIAGIVLVADAKNMKRSIALTLQYAEYGLPMLLVVNMIDESASRGIEINYELLSETLGIPVCTTVARDGIGIQKVLSLLKKMRVPKRLITYPDRIEEFLKILTKLIGLIEISPRIIGILLLTEDPAVEKFLSDRYGPGMLEQVKNLAEEYRREENPCLGIYFSNLYNSRAEKIVRQIQKINPPHNHPFFERVGDWCIQPSTGIPIAIIILYLMYLFVGTFGATFMVDTINRTLFEGLLIPWTTKIVTPIPSVFIRDMLVDPDFGILPTGVFLAIGLVLPVLFCFYIAFGLLEDSGYLPRISILLDKLLQNMGLNGKGLIPLIMGFSCVTMAILTTRMLDTEKEKNIASFLLLLGMPCAPLLAVMFIVLGKMPVSASITVFGIIFVQILLAGIMLNKILPGRRTPLLMEIPVMRWPKMTQVLKMAALKTYFFMKEAVPVFILASFVVFLFDRIGGLAVLERISEPIIGGFMGLPEKSVQVFIKTIIRRESGATEIEHLSAVYNNLQMVVNLLVMTFLSPCMNAIIVLFKERGSKAAAVMIVTVMIYAVLFGSLVNHFCRLLGISFT
jgi:ferrous iron transport protein B